MAAAPNNLQLLLDLQSDAPANSDPLIRPLLSDAPHMPTLETSSRPVPHDLPPPALLPRHAANPRHAPNTPAATAANLATDSPEYPDSDISESDRDDDDEEDVAPVRVWMPIEEDTSRPCTDEIVYIESRREHSALHHAYWEKKAFFNLDDPEVTPGASGRIDWTIDPYNGTKEAPNSAEVLRSAVVSVGGYDWRIKLFPRGDQTDFLSAYLECVTMQDEAFVGVEEFGDLPFPLMRGLHEDTNKRIKKRRSIAVQFGIVMYNPAEPRVYEHKTDAHQFHKNLPEWGFRYFSNDSRFQFHRRKHGQRVPILQNDKLAFSAYIRIVNDPTGSMWQHPGTDSPFDESVQATGLRPFANAWPQTPAIVALLHFTPFRDFLRRCKATSRQVYALQHWLLKFYSRRCSATYGGPQQHTVNDAVSILTDITRELQKECNADAVTALLGSLDPSQGAAIGANRLQTKTHPSIQSAIDKHSKPLETPELLTLELQRQEYDRTARKWNRLTHYVSLNSKVWVNSKKYILFAFATQYGELGTNKHKAYVRPGGPDKLWYAYEDGRVSAMTTKQAVERHSGFCPRPTSVRRDSPFSVIPTTEREGEVAYVVMYVREDISHRVFDRSRYELWSPPTAIIDLVDFLPEIAQEAADQGPGAARNGAEDLDETSLGVSVPALNTERASTPLWPMDGEDVVMSDSDDGTVVLGDLADSIYLASKTSLASGQLKTVTIDAFGREYYQGQVLDGKYHGHGHLIRLNGDEYKGDFQAGKPHGHGKMVYSSNGNTYEGQWENGEHHGQGDLTEFNTKNTYSGGWKEGRKHGEFVLRGVVTEEDRGCCTICYDREIAAAFYDCGHVVCCMECANMVETCPVCRRRVIARLQLYGVKMTLE